MQGININITKAQICSFSVELEGDLPNVYATIKLCNSSGKKISEFSVSTRSYADKNFELPVEMIPAIKTIAEQLEVIVTRECNKDLNILEYKDE